VDAPDAPGGAAARGTLYVVATPIGNLEDLSSRAARLLREAAILAAEDTRTAQRLLNHLGVRAPRLVSIFEGNEAARSAELTAELCAGKDVVLISEAGTPAVSDPGQRLVAAAAAAGVTVVAVPGPSAAIAALVASGLPSGRFLFVGFPPRTEGERRAAFGALRDEIATLIFYEAPDRTAATLADLAAALGDDRAAALCRELTKLHEEIVRGSLAELAGRYADVAPRGEVTLVVAGADPAARRAAVDVEAELRALLEQGLGPKDAAQRLVVKTGLPRRQLYQLALSLERERG
jgi:16S rRNA (cytidine1402-2'-O)-methyltransferase